VEGVGRGEGGERGYENYFDENNFLTRKFCIIRIKPHLWFSNNEFPMNDISQSVDLRDVILTFLADDQRSLAWLSRKIGEVEGMSYANMHSCFVRKIVPLNQEKLNHINKALGTAYTLDAE
jgi:hypothetical protein